MHPLHLLQRANDRLDVLCIGAHCDDIEIGCGGTLLALQETYKRIRVHWLVLTSNARRRDEEQKALQRFVSPRAVGRVSIHELPDGHLPACFSSVKAALCECREAVSPGLVLTHHQADRHQDHALVSEVTWQTFRDHQIWEYEIPKWDADLATPNLYVPLSSDQAKGKVEAIVDTFASQLEKSWFRPENLHALMRVRGLECRAISGFAEGFHSRKLVLGTQASTVSTAPDHAGITSGRCRTRRGGGR